MVFKILLKWIETANARQIDEILRAAVKRRESLFPDWHMIYIAVPKNDKKACVSMLKEMLELARREQEEDSCF